MTPTILYVIRSATSDAGRRYGGKKILRSIEYRWQSDDQEMVKGKCWGLVHEAETEAIPGSSSAL